MPLEHGSSRAVVGRNIAEMEASGHPRDQSIAAALRTARSGYQRGGTVHAGPLLSSVAGRTDHLPIDVAAGSYVVPSDVVSGLGEGNTLAGTKILQRMFTTGPYGLPLGRTVTRRKPRFATGGPVPIVAAGGEYVIPPEVVERIGSGDMKRGHDILDAWIKKERAHTVKTLRKLPGPRQK